MAIDWLHKDDITGRGIEHVSEIDRQSSRTADRSGWIISLLEILMAVAAAFVIAWFLVTIPDFG
ncbi:MAG: hypothetical protein KGI75_07840 [Rhizobiaceae bacterium]|nr:hypothetical protein [Rhizobiaceae bacterium]